MAETYDFLARLDEGGGGSDHFILGATGFTNENSTLTFTDSLIDIGTYSTTTSGDIVVVSSEKDNIFPYNEIEEYTDSYGNVMVKFPKMWMKWDDTDGVVTNVKIANYQVDDTYFIPDCFLDPKDETCSTYLDYFALGKYEAYVDTSSGILKSISGVSPSRGYSITQFRTYAQAYGTADNYYNGYQIIDTSMRNVYNILWCLYYGTINSQSVYAGPVNMSAKVNTGTTDDINGKNGWNTSITTMKCLGIENPWGNLAEWTDGYVTYRAHGMTIGYIYARRLPQDFSSLDTTTISGIPNAVRIALRRSADESGYISKYSHGTTSETQSYMYPSEFIAGTSTYYGDYGYNYFTSTMPVAFSYGATWNSGSWGGLFYTYASGGFSSTSSIRGCRLAYRPVN